MSTSPDDHDAPELDPTTAVPPLPQVQLWTRSRTTYAVLVTTAVASAALVVGGLCGIAAVFQPQPELAVGPLPLPVALWLGASVWVGGWVSRRRRLVELGATASSRTPAFIAAAVATAAFGLQGVTFAASSHVPAASAHLVQSAGTDDVTPQPLKVKKNSCAGGSVEACGLMEQDLVNNAQFGSKSFAAACSVVNELRSSGQTYATGTPEQRLMKICDTYRPQLDGASNTMTADANTLADAMGVPHPH